MSYQRPLIAGWLSLIAHLAAIITGDLLWQAPSPKSFEESARPVRIVLASAAASNEPQYFDEPPASEAAAPSAAAGSGLPDTAAPPSASAEFQLPGELTPIADGIGLPTADASGATSGKVILDPTAGMAEILAEEALRPRARGPEGPQGEVSVFGTAATRGHSFVFLIDRSQSMGSEGLGAIAAAEVELLAALDKLETNHSFQIVAYNQATSYFGQRKLIRVTDDSRQAGREFLAHLTAFGATNHERAIMSALQLKPDVIYLLTDGDPVLTAGQRKRIHDESGGRTTICCIQFGRIGPDDEATRTALEALARENGGSYTFVDMSKR